MEKTLWIAIREGTCLCGIDYVIRNCRHLSGEFLCWTDGGEWTYVHLSKNPQKAGEPKDSKPMFTRGRNGNSASRITFTAPTCTP